MSQLKVFCSIVSNIIQRFFEDGRQKQKKIHYRQKTIKSPFQAISGQSGQFSKNPGLKSGFFPIFVVFFFHTMEKRFFPHYGKKFFSTLWKKRIFFSTLWKKKTIFQIPPNDKSTFHNVVTIEQSYMFNIHFATQSGILKILTEIHFLTPTRSGILYLASPCYASLRSDFAICFALYKIPELLGVKKRISLSTKRIPLFVANDIEQSINIKYLGR